MRQVGSLVAGKVAFLTTSIEGFSFLFLNRISEKIAGIVLVILSFFLLQNLLPSLVTKEVTAVQSNFVLTSPLNNLTHSLFTEKIITQTKAISFQKQTVLDPTLPAGSSKVVQEGRNGQIKNQVQITYHAGTEFSSQVLSSQKEPPVTEVVAVGPSELTVDTGLGNLHYSQKLTLWATAYDSSCYGCSGRTATGLQTGYGVVAVDPSVIPLGSRLYIAGYGQAIAGDTGGSVKGNRIDLGFNNVAQSGWFSHYTDVYILTN